MHADVSETPAGAAERRRAGSRRLEPGNRPPAQVCELVDETEAAIEGKCGDDARDDHRGRHRFGSDGSGKRAPADDSVRDRSAQKIQGSRRADPRPAHGRPRRGRREAQCRLRPERRSCCGRQHAVVFRCGRRRSRSSSYRPGARMSFGSSESFSLAITQSVRIRSTGVPVHRADIQPIGRVAARHELVGKRDVAREAPVRPARKVTIVADRRHADRAALGRERQRHLRLEAVLEQDPAWPGP